MCVLWLLLFSKKNSWGLRERIHRVGCVMVRMFSVRVRGARVFIENFSGARRAALFFDNTLTHSSIFCRDNLEQWTVTIWSDRKFNMFNDLCFLADFKRTFKKFVQCDDGPTKFYTQKNNFMRTPSF